jgi:hypothetical protein
LEELIEEGKPVPKLLDGDITNIPFNWRRNSQDVAFWVSLGSSIASIALTITAFIAIRR